jgi:hypothetical protein
MNTDYCKIKVRKILICCIFTVTWLNILILESSVAIAQNQNLTYQEGDILLQITSTFQSAAIEAATGSPFTHCGIVFKENDSLVVYEAMANMLVTPIETWLKRGQKGRFIQLRLNEGEAYLTTDNIEAMKKVFSTFKDKTYDLLFQWSDETIYCSELVWKIYDRGSGLKLIPLKKLSDYNLENSVVKELIKARYGSKFNPEELAIAPGDFLNSKYLVEVGTN